MSSVQFSRRRAVFLTAIVTAVAALGAGAYAIHSTGAETKAARLQGVTPEFDEDLCAGRQRVQPVWKPVVDLSPAICAEI